MAEENDEPSCTFLAPDGGFFFAQITSRHKKWWGKSSFDSETVFCFMEKAPVIYLLDPI